MHMVCQPTQLRQGKQDLWPVFEYCLGTVKNIQATVKLYQGHQGFTQCSGQSSPYAAHGTDIFVCQGLRDRAMLRSRDALVSQQSGKNA